MGFFSFGPDSEVLKNPDEYHTDVVAWALHYQRHEEPRQQIERRRGLRKTVLMSKIKLMPGYGKFYINIIHF